MATLIKHGARKHLAAGPISTGWGNLPMPGLATRRHVILNIGGHTLRVEEEDAKLLCVEIIRTIDDHKADR